jgi:hypothetical protein
MFGNAVQVRIDLTEKSDDTIHSGHRLLHAWSDFNTPVSLEKVHDYCSTANRYFGL